MGYIKKPHTLTDSCVFGQSAGIWIIDWHKPTPKVGHFGVSGEMSGVQR